MNYGSVCSGIEAATQAWHPLGWTPQWFSEIEPFPCKVLAHHYPEVPNLGDMTKLLNNQTFNEKPIELLVGGTPCQSFSVAGLRAGLDDERGNLALEFVRLLISKRPRWFLWENVPGVLSSSNGSDFAAILSAWTGRDIEPQKFGSAGIIEGPFYSIAWRVLDSQYFGVPQRRRRVFVVGHLGNDWRPSAAVLFERDSLRRDFTPGGKKRKRTASAAEGSTGTSGRPAAVASTLNCAYGDKMGLENQHINEGAPLFVPVHAFKERGGCEGGGEGYLGSDELAFTLSRGQDQSIMQPIVLDDQGGSVMNVSQSGIVGTLRKETHGHEPIVVQPVCFDPSQVTSPTNGGNPQPGAPCHTLAKGAQAPLLVQPAYGIQANIVDRSERSGGNGVGVKEEEAPTLTKSDRHAVFQPIVFGFDSLSSNSMKSKNPISGVHVDSVVKTLDTGFNCPSKNQGGNAVLHGSLIRRLTPVECERLQGFPDDYTNIPGATDSKRYAALGNSMTVNVMQWIGKRIDDIDFITHVIGF